MTLMIQEEKGIVILDGEIKKSGTTGRITVTNKYIGFKAKVLVLDEKFDDKRKN
jgi:putative transposon-encoded protein